MADESRPVEATEAYALGTLHGILKVAGIEVEYPIDVNTRSFDTTGLVPPTKELFGIPQRPTMRITIEEVQ